MGLLVIRREGESVDVYYPGGDVPVRVTVVGVAKGEVDIEISAPREVRILRSELGRLRRRRSHG